MKITICGSMAFAKEMKEIGVELEKLGHEALLPNGVERYLNGDLLTSGGVEGTQRKIDDDLIRAHYNLIKDSDAILVLNYKKRDTENYIGGNSFLEIGFAFVLNKKIYLLNPVPEMGYKDEIVATLPVILNGDLSQIK